MPAERSIQILRCSGLTDEDPFGGNDPFVVVLNKENGNEIFRSKVKESAGSTTEWKDAIAALEDTHSALTVQVWDKDVTSDDLIGGVDVEVPAVNSGAQRLEIFKAEGVSAGFVTILFKVPEQKEEQEEVKEKNESTPSTPTEKEEKQPLAPKPPSKPSTPRSSHRNSRANSSDTKRLLQIKKVSGLTDEDPFGSNDPFVVVLDASSKKELYRTNALEEAGNKAEWTNTFAVVPHSSTTLTLQVWDHDPGQNDLIGQVDVVVPHAGSELTLDLSKADGAQAGRLFVAFTTEQQEASSTSESPAKKRKPPVPYKAAAPTPKKRSKIPPPPSRESGGGRPKKLHILKCTGLTDEDPVGGNDPYVVVFAGEQQLLRTETKHSEGSVAAWKNAVAKLRGSISQVTIQVWDEDAVGSPDLIGSVMTLVPKATSAERLQLTKEDGALAGLIHVQWMVAESTSDRLASPKQRHEPALHYTPKADKPWEPKLTTSFQCSERLLKPLPRGPGDDKIVEEPKDDGTPKKKVHGCSDRLAGTTHKEPAPLPSLVESKQLDEAEMEKQVEHLYAKSIEQRERTQEYLERKFIGEPEDKSQSQDQIEDNVTRMYTSEMEKQRRSRDALERKYLNRNKPKGKKLERDEQAAFCSRLYNDGVQHVKEVNDKLTNKYMQPVHSPRRSEAQWKDTVSRLTVPK